MDSKMQAVSFLMPICVIAFGLSVQTVNGKLWFPHEMKPNKSSHPPTLGSPPAPSVHKHRDCSSLICNAPLTNTPAGMPCGCVWPIQVGLRLSIPLYTLFPLVQKLVKEIATSVSLRRTQLRVMGAMCATEQPEKTTVLIDLIPIKAQFDTRTVYLTYYKFWHKLVAINSSIFGDYEVLYIQYPGLPPSSPPQPMNETRRGTNSKT